jgi:hypothetical protein
MSDSRTVQGKIKVQSDSREAVAFELMEKIGQLEQSESRKTRAYWLTLYRQCYKATDGEPLANVLVEN